MEQSNNILINLENNSAKKLNVSLSLIQTARTQRRTKALSVYYFLKSTFRNSCVYSYKSRMGELADSLGICEKTLYNYLHHLRRLGLIYEHSGNLMLYSTKRIKADTRERKRYKITINENDDIKTIESRLFAKIIETHCNKISFHRAVKRFEKKCFVNRDRYKKTAGENDNRTSISIRNLQKLLNLSQLRTKNLVKTLNELDVIRTAKRKPVLLDYGCAPLKYSTDYPGYFFTRDGYLFVVYGNTHELLEYPAEVRELTYKQYLKIKKTETCKN